MLGEDLVAEMPLAVVGGDVVAVLDHLGQAGRLGPERDVVLGAAGRVGVQAGQKG